VGLSGRKVPKFTRSRVRATHNCGVRSLCAFRPQIRVRRLAAGRAARRYQKPLFRRRGGNGGYLLVLLLLKQLDVFK
jgi:hypothetical protein